jgi:prevent-host-death family protein
MSTTTISSREFNQDTSKAKKAAASGPVIITDRGKPAHVLLSMKAYQKLVGHRKSLLEAVAQPGDDADFEFEFPRLGDLCRPAEFE